jgi:toxin ParE2
MTAMILDEAEADLQNAFDFYEKQRAGLGEDFIDEFRRTLDPILQHPNAWTQLDPTYRRCRFHRFPYGIIYRLEVARAQIVLVAVMHLSRRPDWWRDRG